MFNFIEEIKGVLKNAEGLESFNIINLSGKMLYVEGHLGLLTLSKETISFKVKKGVILVQGKDMILAELCENTIKISGTITKVEQL